MYILDTNILIYFFKGVGRVSSHLLSVEPENIGIPSIVIYELRTGIAKSIDQKKRSEQLIELCSMVDIIPFGDDEAIYSAEIRADLEKKGTPIGPYDILIAGTAMAQKAKLVTHNINEFKRINGLEVVDWY
ncbi:MAG: VapC toxin family PIN domain ribonuclease [Spirochaetes bacterium]|nr:MAG: VapC toxin family PIN domain ribonuclease [Spirochaetota bacterium]RKX84980.1 MAG: VapC toxin family PIN domain ribonuclease [Spirochaetota bacterium]RKX89535.1 MAG: VapC toxin family PIN domain ribonuclease [Spirochaetota bacterium]